MHNELVQSLEILEEEQREVRETSRINKPSGILPHNFTNRLVNLQLNINKTRSRANAIKAILDEASIEIKKQYLSFITGEGVDNE